MQMLRARPSSVFTGLAKLVLSQVSTGIHQEFPVELSKLAVKTLAIRSTVEEFMLARREAMKGQTTKPVNWSDDRDTRHFIAVR
jgi:hypothetical protein